MELHSLVEHAWITAHPEVGLAVGAFDLTSGRPSGQNCIIRVLDLVPTPEIATGSVPLVGAFADHQANWFVPRYAAGNAVCLNQRL